MFELCDKNTTNKPINFSLFNLDLVYEMVHRFLTFNLRYDLVYDWYMLSIQKMTNKMTMTENV